MEKSKSKPKIYYFESASVPRAFLSLAVPTIVSQIISVIYNFADTWFVGRVNDPLAIAAINVTMPVFIIIGAIANLFGVGGSALIARFLGLRQEANARSAFAFSLWFGLLTGAAYSLILFLFQKPIIYLVGGTDETYHLISEYLFYVAIVGGAPTLLTNLFGHLVRGTGAGKEAGIGMSLGAILNIFFDPLFIFVLMKDSVVAAAAVATLLANLVSTLYFIVYLLRHRDHPVYTLNPKDIAFGESIPQNVLFIGFPAALGTTLAMLSNIVANALMASHGAVAQAGLGLAKKANTLAFGVCMGITQGMLPFISYNNAQKNYARMKAGIRFMFGVALIYSIITMTLYLLFPNVFISFFLEEAETVAFGVSFLRIIALAVPTCAICYAVNVVFQATGKKWRSLLLSTLRKGLFDIPLMFLLNASVGAVGILWATPLAEIASVVVTLAFFIPYMKRLS